MIHSDYAIPFTGDQKPRKPYRKPLLETLGDLRTLTLGGSPGLNDSGNQWVMKPPVGLSQPGFTVGPDGNPFLDSGSPLP